jgi:hypothetical protein
MAEEPRTTPMVPDDFVVPTELRSTGFRLEPLGPHHNARDHKAWMSSIAHLQTTPGFEGRGWPPDEGFSAEQNLDDLVVHAEEFERRAAFAYSVLDPDSDRVIGASTSTPATGTAAPAFDPGSGPMWPNSTRRYASPFAPGWLSRGPSTTSNTQAGEHLSASVGSAAQPGHSGADALVGRGQRHPHML